MLHKALQQSEKKKKQNPVQTKTNTGNKNMIKSSEGKTIQRESKSQALKHWEPKKIH